MSNDSLGEVLHDIRKEAYQRSTAFDRACVEFGLNGVNLRLVLNARPSDNLEPLCKELMVLLGDRNFCLGRRIGRRQALQEEGQRIAAIINHMKNGSWYE